MKFILATLLSLFMVACGTQTNIPNYFLINETYNIHLDHSREHVANTISVARVLFFDENQRPFFVSTMGNDTLITSHNSAYANVLRNATIAWDSIAFNDSKTSFFLPVREETGMVSIRKLETGAEWTEPETIRYVDGIFANFFTHGDYLIIFEPQLTPQGFLYNVIKFDLSTLDETLIISSFFDFDTHSGDILSNIYVTNDNIFVYRINENTERNFYIDSYSLDGEFIESIRINFSSFLYMQEVSDEDSVIRFMKYDELFIFETLHERVGIFVMRNGTLEEISIPNELQLLGQTNLIGVDNQHRLYFFNFENSSLFSLNAHTFELIRYNITFENFEDVLFNHISSIDMDEYGNFIIGVQVDMDKVHYVNMFHYDSKVFFFLDNETLKNKSIG